MQVYCMQLWSLGVHTRHSGQADDHGHAMMSFTTVIDAVPTTHTATQHGCHSEHASLTWRMPRTEAEAGRSGSVLPLTSSQL